MFSARGRRTFITVSLSRGVDGELLASPVPTGQSGAITTLANANGYVELKSTEQFLEAGEATEEEVDKQFSLALSLTEDLESKNMLRNEEDSLGAILKINSGAGGTESQDWAEMLLRMYLRYGEKHEYKSTKHNKTSKIET